MGQFYCSYRPPCLPPPLPPSPALSLFLFFLTSSSSSSSSQVSKKNKQINKINQMKLFLSTDLNRKIKIEIHRSPCRFPDQHHRAPPSSPLHRPPFAWQSAAALQRLLQRPRAKLRNDGKETREGRTCGHSDCSFIHSFTVCSPVLCWIVQLCLIFVKV